MTFENPADNKSGQKNESEIQSIFRTFKEKQSKMNLYSQWILEEGHKTEKDPAEAEKIVEEFTKKAEPIIQNLEMHSVDFNAIGPEKLKALIIDLNATVDEYIRKMEDFIGEENIKKAK